MIKVAWPRIVHRIILALLLISLGSDVHSQSSDSTLVPSEVPSTLPELSITPQVLNDSLALDSISLASTNDSGVNSSIFYDAQDSMILDIVNGVVHLYGNAVVKFEGIEVKAAYVQYDFKNNLACATGIRDSLDVLQGKPEVNDNGQSFTQEEMCYNFKTKQGFSRNSVTQEGDAVFHAGVSKRHENGWIHIRKGKFTTCTAENPHFHFELSKAIIVPDDKVVTGPFYMKVRKVPVPLGLPFGWFPTKNKSSHGVIIPGYGDANNLGFFLKDGGYYFPIGDFADTRFLGDIYSRGSWGLKNITNYKRRYRYSGNFNISRTVIKSGFKELPSYSESTEFFVRWTHNQDPKARPNSRFSANVNLGSRNNFRRNINSSQDDFLTNTFNSSIQYNQSFPGRPWNLTLSARHSQNSATGNVDLTLPSLTLNRNRTFLPLGVLGSSRSTKTKLDKLVSVTYSANIDNLLSAEQTRFRFDNIEPLSRDLRNGVRQTVALNSQLKAKFITIIPNFTYNEYWNFKSLEVNVDPDTGIAQRDTVAGFTAARDYRTSVSATTRFYGLFNFKNAKNVKAIRHVITPSVGMGYTPFYDRNVYGFFGDDGAFSSYNPFSPGRFVPSNSGESWSINASIANNVEMKVRDKNSEKNPFKKIKLIDNFAISGNYNVIADSLNLSDISMRAFTTLFKKVNINYSSRHSAYDRNESGQRIDTYLIDSQNRLLRMTNASLSLGTSFRSSKKKGKRNTENATEEQLEFVENNPSQFVDFNIPWSLNIDYTMDLTKRFDAALLADTNDIRQSMRFNGDFTILKNWKVGFNSGYDFVSKELTTTTLNLYWDLHCWEFAFNWVPFGERQSFSLQLNIKSSLLQDLKLQARGGPDGVVF